MHRMCPFLMRGHLLDPKSAAHPSPSPPAPGGAERPGLLLPLDGATDLTTTCTEGGGRGRNHNNNKINNPRIVRNAGSRPRGAPGGSGAQRRDTPFPQETLGVPAAPRRLPGLGPREPPEQSWGQAGERSRPSYRENILSGTGRRRRPVLSRGAGQNPSHSSRSLLLRSRKLVVKCPQPAWVLMAECLISPTLSPQHFFSCLESRTSPRCSTPQVFGQPISRCHGGPPERGCPRYVALSLAHPGRGQEG